MNEAPISGNVKIYYKGYSIQLTCRNPEVSIEPLFQKMLKIVNEAEKHDCKPSWNDDTNKKVTQPAVVLDYGLTSICKEHGVPMTQGFSQTKQKHYWYHDNAEGVRCFGNGFMEKK